MKYVFTIEDFGRCCNLDIKLYLAISETWESTGMTSNNDMVNVLSELKCKAFIILQKGIYLHLLESISGSGTRKKHWEGKNDVTFNDVILPVA